MIERRTGHDDEDDEDDDDDIIEYIFYIFFEVQTTYCDSRMQYLHNVCSVWLWLYLSVA